MKKLKLRIILLIVLFITILLTNQSNADMSAPMTYRYRASVSNVNGASNYEYDTQTKKIKVKGTFDYGKEINIIYEEEFNGEKYGVVGSEEENIIIGYVKLSDIIPIKKEFNINDENVYSCNLSGIVLADKGVTIHKGPANSFAQVGKVIPQNTILIFNKQYGKGGDASPAWYYTEYQGNKGWVCILDGVIGFEKEKGTYITPVEVEITKEEKKIGTIPANTVIENYYNIDGWSQAIYVSYNGVDGLVDIKKLASSPVSYSVKVTTNKNIMLYQQADDNSKVLTSIPVNTTFDVKWEFGYGYLKWAYVTYNGKEGWIHVVNDYEDENGTWRKEINATEELIYEQTEQEDDELISYLENEVIPSTYYKENIIEHNNTEEYVGLNGIQIVIICVIVALIITVTSSVTILLINKSKK